MVADGQVNLFGLQRVDDTSVVWQQSKKLALLIAIMNPSVPALNSWLKEENMSINESIKGLSRIFLMTSIFFLSNAYVGPMDTVSTDRKLWLNLTWSSCFKC